MSAQVQEFNGFRLTIKSDIDYLAPKLRKEDKLELLAVSGNTPYQSLLNGYLTSDKCFTITDHDNWPVGMFGVSQEGAIWLLATPEIKRIRFSFLRESRKVVNFLNNQYPKLWNFVDCRNELHLRWLKWCGFKFITKTNYGVLNKPFYYFEKLCVNQ